MRQEGGPESIVRCGRRIAEEKAGRGEPMQFAFSVSILQVFRASSSSALRQQRYAALRTGALQALALGSPGHGAWAWGMGPPGAWSLGASCMPKAPPKFPSSKTLTSAPLVFSSFPSVSFVRIMVPALPLPAIRGGQGSGPCAGCCAQQRGPFRCRYEIRRALFRALAAGLGRWAASRCAGSCWQCWQQ